MRIYHVIMKMGMENRCFLFSIVFQVAGALILLLKSFASKKKQIVGECFDNSDGKLDNETYVTLEYCKVVKILAEIYYNRLSFVYLVIGYSLTIWADIGDFSRNKMFKYVIQCSVILLIVSALIALIASSVAAIFYRNIKFKDIPSGSKIRLITKRIRQKDGSTIEMVQTIIKE